MAKKLQDLLLSLQDPTVGMAQNMLSAPMSAWLGTLPTQPQVADPGLANFQPKIGPQVPTTIANPMDPQTVQMDRDIQTFLNNAPVPTINPTSVSGEIPGAAAPLPYSARGNPGQSLAPANTGTPFRVTGTTKDLMNPYDPHTAASAAWAKANVGSVRVGGANVQVNKEIAPIVEAFLNELVSTGYKLDPASTGGYNDRWQKHGGKEVPGKKSMHQSALAFDINWNKNAQGQKGTDLPKNIREFASKYGLKWGMDFKDPDPMHFEFSGSKADAQKLAETLGIKVKSSDTKAEIVSQLKAGIATTNSATAPQSYSGMYAGKPGNRSTRNNNPGNIIYGDFAKKLGATGSDGTFAIFPSRDAGYNALKTLVTGNSYKDLSISEAMHKYAPGSDGNDPVGYAKFLSKTIGVPATTRIKDLNSSQVQALIQAIAKKEG